MLTIRLRRMGRKDRAFYRFVVSDSRKTPTASAVEEVGHYDPLQRPPEIQLKQDRIDYWVGHGAILSNTVKTLIRRAQNGTLLEKEAKPKAKKEAAEKAAPTTEVTASAPAAEVKPEEPQPEAATEAKAAAEEPTEKPAEAAETSATSEGEPEGAKGEEADNA